MTHFLDSSFNDAYMEANLRICCNKKFTFHNDDIMHQTYQITQQIINTERFDYDQLVVCELIKNS